MQNIPMAVKQRALAEYEDFDVDYPHWLRSILTDDLRYVITLITLITVCANSFGLGVVLGWIATL